MSETPPPPRVSGETLERLANAAWDVREHAYVLGPTKVGCAVLADDGRIFAGCNIEHHHRCHDVHAEVNAISAMVAAGGRRLLAVVVAAERQRFTPCGGCLDWIFQFGGQDCVVAYAAAKDGPLVRHTAKDLMPYYPQ